MYYFLYFPERWAPMGVSASWRPCMSPVVFTVGIFMSILLGSTHEIAMIHTKNSDITRLGHCRAMAATEIGWYRSETIINTYCQVIGEYLYNSRWEIVIYIISQWHLHVNMLLLRLSPLKVNNCGFDIQWYGPEWLQQCHVGWRTRLGTNSTLETNFSC